MDYLLFIVIAIAVYYSIKTSRSKGARKLFIGMYVSIFIIGFAYISGEAIGKAFYYLGH